MAEATVESCPTCASPVSVVTEGEGTSHYEPTLSQMCQRAGCSSENLAERVIQLEAEVTLYRAAIESVANDLERFAYHDDPYYANDAVARLRGALSGHRPTYGDGTTDATDAIRRGKVTLKPGHGLKGKDAS